MQYLGMNQEINEVSPIFTTTPNKIINARVDTLSKIGFKEAKTLEPMGKFLVFLPYKTYAAKLDSISSRIKATLSQCKNRS